jgi:hypothetical protein
MDTISAPVRVLQQRLQQEVSSSQRPSQVHSPLMKSCVALVFAEFSLVLIRQVFKHWTEVLSTPSLGDRVLSEEDDLPFKVMQLSKPDRQKLIGILQEEKENAIKSPISSPLHRGSSHTALDQSAGMSLTSPIGRLRSSSFMAVPISPGPRRSSSLWSNGDRMQRPSARSYASELVQIDHLPDQPSVRPLPSRSSGVDQVSYRAP